MSVLHGGEVVERALAASRADEAIVLVTDAAEASLRWAGNSMTTNGSIKKIVADRGFGFIAAEDAKEYFFHRGGLDSTLDFDRLVGGEKVEFEIEQSPKGPRASRVHAA